jgi:predicted ATP-dependent serine protease
MVLLGGIPGAGKSTLTMQWVGAWAKRYTHAHPAYITTEESLKQIAIRADRLEIRERIKLYTGADLHPDIAKGTSLVVLDSLQGLCGNNDLLQEETMSALKASAMKYHVPVIVTSHITKDELLAGRMTIQHLVDVTAMLYNEDDLRTLVALKSRIGPAFYETIFSMTEYGLHRVRCSRSGTKALDEPGKG